MAETLGKSTVAPDAPHPPDLPKGEGDKNIETEPPATDASGPFPAEPRKSVDVREGLKAFADAHAFDPVVLATILACREDHPAWSAEQIRKALRIKRSVVEEVLNDPELRRWGLV
jgi:hypothetical protein